VRAFLHTSRLLCCLLAGAVGGAGAFDNDFTINEIEFGEGNFLDINASQFTRTQDLRWYDALNGWRMAGGSLDSDRLYLRTDLKFEHHLSEKAFVRLEAEQEVFYARKEFPSPTVEVGAYPAGRNLGFSVVGRPYFDKRQADLGLALTLGRRPWDYLHFAWTQTDLYFNEKNDFDDSRYLKEGDSFRLQGAYRLGGPHRLRFLLQHDTPLEFLEVPGNELFAYEGSRYDLAWNYLLARDEFVGVTLRGFETDKSLEDAAARVDQELGYHSLDAFWVGPWAARYQVTLGFRYDDFRSRTRSAADAASNRDDDYNSWQLYGTWRYEYSLHSAWDVGLYGSWEERRRATLLVSDIDDYDAEGVQGKLRLGWAYRSSDRRSELQFNFSLDLDEITEDVTDGGAVSFQTVF
jgi:hypothetical protein